MSQKPSVIAHTHTHTHTHAYIHTHTLLVRLIACEHQIFVAHSARGVTVRTQNIEVVAPSVLVRKSIPCAALAAGEAKDVIAKALAIDALIKASQHV
jgi:hypothetical protein